MTENQQNQSNVAPNNGPVDNIQERMVRMEIEKKEEKEYPERPGEVDCMFFVRNGYCDYAANCRFNHPPASAQTDESKGGLPQREGQPDCGHYVKTGTCKFGSTCRYHHPLDRRGAEEISFNSMGLPLRKAKDCPYYLYRNTCMFGAACKFNHPELTEEENALPGSEVAARGLGLSLPSSNGIPYFGASPPWSWPSSSCFPGSMACMSYFFPGYQTAVPTQNWNNFLGNMSSVGGSSIMGTDLAYTSKNPGELVNGGQANLSAMTVPNLPERPDQPECRNFNRYGGCKYGSSCKYHHPKEFAHTLGPHDLHLRPGGDMCAHFGPHGCIPGYYFGMPPMFVGNQPSYSSQRNIPTHSSTGTSQSKSSKITGWIQKPETVGGNNSQHSAIRPVEVSHIKVDDQSNASVEDSHDKVDDQSNDRVEDSHENVDDQSTRIEDSNGNVVNGAVPEEQSD